MVFFRCIALAFIGACAAVNIRQGARAKFPSPTVTHLLKDPIGAIGGDSLGSVAQAMAGPQVDGAIAKQLEQINSNPFDTGSADKGNEDLKEVHHKIQRYLGKLNQLYAIAAPKDVPKQALADQDGNSTNATSDNNEEEDEEQQEEMPDIKLPALRKAVLTAAIKKAASSALQAADSKMKEDLAAEEARHTAAVQNLTSVALKEKASSMTAKWRVMQAMKAKKKARDMLTKLQTHEMKTQMAINTLTEHGNSVKTDIEEASKELAGAATQLKERMKAFKEQSKVFQKAQDALLEEKSSQIQKLFEKQAGAGNAEDQDAALDSTSMERFLSVRN